MIKEMFIPRAVAAGFSPSDAEMLYIGFRSGSIVTGIVFFVMGLAVGLAVGWHFL